MTATVTTQFRQQFDDSLRLAAQQRESRLMRTVFDRGTISGDSFTVNNLGSIGLLDENNERHGDTQWSEIDHTSRLVGMRDFFKALPLDRADIPKMAVNPVAGGQYMTSLLAARDRRIDDIIYKAVLADILSKDGSTTYSVPSAQKIVAGGTGLTKSKILQTKAIFRSNEADEMNGEELFFLYNSTALQQILADTTLTSADYMTVQMLQQGAVAQKWCGFIWIPYEALTKSGSTFTTAAYCKSAIHFGRGYEEGDVAKRPDKKNAYQTSMAASYGAGRQDEKKVVQVDFQ